MTYYQSSYLGSLGYSVANNMFKDNSWFFRNALVRANYADHSRGVQRDWRYLESFFKNLLLGEHNEKKSRYLLIGLTEEDKRKIRELTEGGVKADAKTRVKTTQKTRVKTTQKTVVRILGILSENPCSTRRDLALATGLTEDGVKWHLQHLKAAGRLRRIGPDKGGHWEVVK